MNIVRCRTIKRYPSAVITYGYETEPYRRELGIDKTHYNDAISIVKPSVSFSSSMISHRIGANPDPVDPAVENTR